VRKVKKKGRGGEREGVPLKGVEAEGKRWKFSQTDHPLISRAGINK